MTKQISCIICGFDLEPCRCNWKGRPVYCQRCCDENFKDTCICGVDNHNDKKM